MTSFCLGIFLTIFFFWPPSSISASTDFIKSKCTSTDYPNLCIASLFPYTSAINDNPVHLVDAALNVSLSSACTISALMARLKPSSLQEAEAVSDCVELLKDTVSYLRQSLREMDGLKGRGKEVAEQINDVQTRVSTALTDESTCMDGFGSNDGGQIDVAAKLTRWRVEGAVRGGIVRLAQLTSNALALISCLRHQNR